MDGELNQDQGLLLEIERTAKRLSIGGDAASTAEIRRLLHVVEVDFDRDRKGPETARDQK
jgi:hypothetical protein